MNNIVTQGIVLRRTNFGEADRIVVVLTPDQGKISVVAKGVRRLKSKLAGGIELFSVSSMTIMKGRGELGTLVSSRLDIHYGDITKDIARVQTGYELIKLIDKNTEPEAGPEYFRMLQSGLEALNDARLSPNLIGQWFIGQLLVYQGHTPNLQTDREGTRLEPGMQYNFDLESMSFEPNENGDFDQNHIKYLRLLLAADQPLKLRTINDIPKLVDHCAQLVNLWRQQYIT